MTAPSTNTLDGFGPRTIGIDAESGDRVELLDLPPELVEHEGFVTALTERVARFTTMRHTSYGHLRRLDQPEAGRLQLVSDLTPGWRLSELFAESRDAGVAVDINVFIGLMRQLLPAVALYARHNRDAAIGTLAPERLIVTPQARLVIAEHAFGPPLEKMNFGREKLWRDYRVTMPPSAGLPRANQPADAMGIGAVALSLLLGRVLAPDEFPSQLDALVAGAQEHRDGQSAPVSPALVTWLKRALHIDQENGFQSPSEAQLAFETVLISERSYVMAPGVLEKWVTALGERIDARKEPEVLEPEVQEAEVQEATVQEQQVQEEEIDLLAELAPQSEEESQPAVAEEATSYYAVPAPQQEEAPAPQQDAAPAPPQIYEEPAPPPQVYEEAAAPQVYEEAAAPQVYEEPAPAPQIYEEAPAAPQVEEPAPATPEPVVAAPLPDDDPIAMAIAAYKRKPAAPVVEEPVAPPPPPPPIEEPAPPAAEEPAAQYEEPVAAAEEPAPIYEAPAPVYEEPAPVHEEPVVAKYEEPAPAYEEPAPTYEPPPPAYEEPAPQEEAPATEFEAPAATKYEEPAAAKYEEPAAPVYEPPAPARYEEPAAPVYVEPAPKYEAPVYQPPAPAYEPPPPPQYEPPAPPYQPAASYQEPAPYTPPAPPQYEQPQYEEPASYEQAPAYAPEEPVAPEAPPAVEPAASSVPPEALHAPKAASRMPLMAMAAVIVVLLGAVGWLATRGGGESNTGNGEVAITTRNPGANVKIDGKPSGVTPLTVSLPPGPHVVEVQMGNGEPRVVPVMIKSGVQTAQYVELPEPLQPQKVPPEKTRKR